MVARQADGVQWVLLAATVAYMLLAPAGSFAEGRTSHESKSALASLFSESSPRRTFANASNATNIAGVKNPAEYEEGESIQISWSGIHVIWSLLISAIGGYVALSSAMIDVKQVRGTRWYWILVGQAACSLGVTSVWSMHFIGMYAMELRSPGKPQVEILYEPACTIVSALAAWLIVAIALHIILGQDHFGDRRDLDKRLQGLTTFGKVRWLVTRMPLRRLSVAVVLVSVGVVVMHYMGMLSQTGHFRMKFSVMNILGSAVVAVVAAWIALPIFLVSFDSMAFRFVSSIGISGFVNSMHYTGMTAATYTYASVQGGIFGPGTYGLKLGYKDIIIWTLLLDLCLMGLTGYYVELAREFVKMEERDVERKLAFDYHKNNVKKLIVESKRMSFPMALVRYDTFARLGKLVAHEVLRDSHKLIYLNTVKSVLRLKKRNNHIVFFSHQWLSHGLPDPANDHYADMMAALQGLAQMFRVKLESLYIFVDYSSIPQEGQILQQLAIDSLATYVSLSSAFVIVAPQTVHRDTTALCNFDTYSKRFWCRLEVFCTILSSLRETELKSVEADQILEEDESDLQEESGKTTDKRPQTTEFSAQQRVFVVVKNSLHSMNFFTPTGALQPRYHDLLKLFDGQTTCCEHGHKEGEEHLCDKCRVVDSLTGAYGAMLQDLRKTKRLQPRGNTGHALPEQFMLIEEIVRQRAEIFPEKYFETRIEAVHARLDRGRQSVIDGGDKHGEDEAADMDTEAVEISDGDDSDSKSSSSASAPSSTSATRNRRGPGSREDSEADAGVGLAQLAEPSAETYETRSL